MKILPVEKIQKADQYTIENEPIASIDLMERASSRVAQWILSKFSKRYKICVLAGSGNNGGDGLAVARLLDSYGYKVFVLLVLGDSGSDDFNTNLERLRKISSVQFKKNVEGFKEISGDKIYIDAVFGSGLSRDVEKKPAEIIGAVNELGGVKIAIDMPSGVYADKHSGGDVIFRADFTLSFQLPKLAFMMPENGEYVGKWYILDIGLHADFLKKVETEYFLYEPASPYSKGISEFSHKGTRGRATVIAGGFGKMGAAILALKGALHSGIGLVTAQVCRPSINVVQNTVPESLIIEDEREDVLGTFHDYSDQDVIVMGPAIGKRRPTRDLLEKILNSFRGQLILDADAINILSENRGLLELLPQDTILTPHPGEFRRLTGDASNDFERLEKLQSFCRKYKVVTVLKGKFTAVCNAEGLVTFNPTGNSGMAKGGSGDLLCGIIAGISQREKNAYETAKLAVFLHGLAGDFCREKLGENFMSPTDLLDYLSVAEKSG